jgi:hypothetical protein
MVLAPALLNAKSQALYIKLMFSVKGRTKTGMFL